MSGTVNLASYPMANEIMGPKEEPTTVTCLNGTLSSCILNTYTHR